jgi:hypothetical protein
MNDEQQHRIDKAQAKSAEQAAAGVFPYHLSTTSAAGQIVSRWTVPSRTTAGTHYSVSATRPAGPMDASAIRTHCDCPAIGVCWHRAHVRSAMLGAIRYRTSAGKYASAPKAANAPHNALRSA